MELKSAVIKQRRKVVLQILPCDSSNCDKCQLSSHLFDRSCKNFVKQEQVPKIGQGVDFNARKEYIHGITDYSQEERGPSSQDFSDLSSSCDSQETMLKRFRKPGSVIKPVARSKDEETDERPPSQVSSQSSSGAGIQALKYSVLWAKLSTRKHKKWEGDGFLIVNGTNLTLKNDAGKTIDSGQNLKLPELENGVILRVGSREVEIQDLCTTTSEEQCDQSLDLVNTNTSEMNDGRGEFLMTTAPKDLNRKQFVIPCQAGSYAPVDKGNKNTANPLFDPHAADALVLAEPTEEHQRFFNKNYRPVVSVVVDPHLSRHLRPHQREGVKFLYNAVYLSTDRESETEDVAAPTGAILADDMGLGKTLQCITFLWTLHRQGPYARKEICNKILIVTPSSLVNNWEKEFLRWLGNERLRVFAVNSQRPVEKCPGNLPVIIISYEMAIRSESLLRSKKFDLIICDEAHKIKNRKNQAYQLLAGMDCKRKILLTGTPVQNDLMELYALVELVRPGSLGSESSFRSEFMLPIEACKDSSTTSKAAVIAAEALNEKISPFFLRRDSTVMLQYLPNRVTQIVFCQPSLLQKRIYDVITSSSEAEKIINGSSQSPLALILTLKKLSNHPTLVHPTNACDKTASNDLARSISKCFPGGISTVQNSRIEDSGKLVVLVHMLQIFTGQNQKVVVVSHYTQTLSIIENVCGSKNMPTLRLDGSVASKDRISIVTKFSTATEPFVFLLSSKAGGVGLNLQSSSKIILYDIDWNPAHDAQAMARCWRPGQKHETHIYRLIASGTIEERIYQRQITKQSVSGSVVDLLHSGAPSFSKEELKDIFTFYDSGCITHQTLGCQCKGDGTNILTNVCFGRNESGEPLPKKSKIGAVNRIGELMQWEHFEKDEIMNSYMDSAVQHPMVDFVFRHRSSGNDSIEELNLCDEEYENINE